MRQKWGVFHCLFPSWAWLNQTGMPAGRGFSGHPNIVGAVCKDFGGCKNWLSWLMAIPSPQFWAFGWWEAKTDNWWKMKEFQQIMERISALIFLIKRVSTKQNFHDFWPNPSGADRPIMCKGQLPRASSTPPWEAINSEVLLDWTLSLLWRCLRAPSVSGPLDWADKGQRKSWAKFMALLQKRSTFCKICDWICVGFGRTSGSRDGKKVGTAAMAKRQTNLYYLRISYF